MAKSIEKVEKFTPPEDADQREVIVVETDDGVRYVFERDIQRAKPEVSDGPVVMFSHRFIPTEPAGDNHVESNYRLPEKVAAWVRSEYGEYDYLDEMIPEAQRNATSRAKLNG